MPKKLLLCSKAGRVLQERAHLFADLPKSSKLVAITTAAQTYAPDQRPWFDEEMSIVKSLGFTVIEYDIAGKPAEDIERVLKDAAIIYVSGGSCFYLLDQMNKTGFAKILDKALNCGAIYVGSSAGAMVLGPSLEYADGIDKKENATLTSLEALNVIPFRILPHLDNPKYTEKYKVLLPQLKQKYTNIFALNDNQSIFIDDGLMEIYG